MSDGQALAPGTGFTGPIFVVGAPRTGTTLTMQILNRHPAIHLYNEVHYNERIYDTMPSAAPLDDRALTTAADRLLAAVRWQGAPAGCESPRDHLVALAHEGGGTHAALFAAFLAAEAAVEGKTIWGDSSPQDVLYISRLRQWYPGAKFIGVVRDPRGFLASYKNYYRKQLSTYRNRFNPLANSLLWRSYMRTLLRAKSSPLGDDIHLLRYEELVADPEGEVTRLCDFLGIGFDAQMLAVGAQNSSYFSVREDDKQKGISAGSRDRWRTELDTVEVWLMQRIARREMEQLGFAPIDARLGAGDLGGLLRILLALPGRVFNLLFRTGKPFTLGKLKRVMGRTD